MTTILGADRVWDGVSSETIQRGFVSFTGGTVDAVGRIADLPSDTAIEDLGDATILPGLINAHVHVTFNASRTVLDDHLAEREAGFDTLYARAQANLLESARAGVTTVRDLGTLNEVVFTARQAVRDGTIVGSDIVAAGEGLTSQAGHCWFFGIECAGEDELRAAVRRQYAAGADLIKIFATGGNLTPNTDPFAVQFTLDELRAAVDEARAHDMPIAAHAHAPAGIANAAEAAVDTIEHCMFETAERVAFDEAVAAKIAEHDVRVVPTPGYKIFEIIDDPSVLDGFPPERTVVIRRIASRFAEFAANFRRMRELGVELVAGTDSGIPERLFGDFPSDLAVFARDDGFGMGTAATIAAATSRCASALGLDDRGVLAPGKRADILAVHGDPLADLTALQSPVRVYVAGRSVL